MLREQFDRILSAEPEPETLTDLIARARIAAGYAQNQLAAELDISPTAWSRLERHGTLKISPEKLIEACHLIGLDAYDVFFRLGLIHPYMEEKILSDWKLYDELRKALGL